MESLYIKATEQTPEIDFNVGGVLKITGVSLPENINTYYDDITRWLECYKEKLPSEVILIVNMEYFNTASFGVLLKILRIVVSFNSSLCQVKIKWLFEVGDDDLLDEGHKLQQLIKYEFEFIEIN